MVALVCHPDAMTPDGNPLLGPIPDVPGFWLAAGLSLNGFGGAGGLGRTIAEWITTGETELDTHGYRAWRFGAAYRNPAQVEAAGREVYRYYYRLRYPLDTDEWGRPNRLGPLHERLQDEGAVFGVEERVGAARLLPAGPAVATGGGRPARVRLAPAALLRPPGRGAHGVSRTRRHDRHELVRQDRGGRDRAPLALLDRVTDNRVDRDPGSVVYTQFLNPVRRDRGRRDRHPARPRPLPRRHRRRHHRLRPGLAAGAHRAGRWRAVASRRQCRAGRDRHLGPARPRRGGGHHGRRRLRRRRSASARRSPSRSAAPPCWPSGSPTWASSASSCTSPPSGRSRCGTGCGQRAAGTASRSAATACLSHCGWRRATATWAPT